MYRTTKKWTWTKAALNLMLVSAGTDTPTFTLAGTKIKAVQNDFTDNGMDTVIGDVTISTFTGFAATTLGTIAASTPSISGPLNVDTNNQGLNVSVIQACTVAPAAPGENITGEILTSGSDTILLGFTKFSEAVPITQVGDFLQFDLVIPGPSAITINP